MLLGIDGQNLDENAVHSAVHVVRLTQSKLTAIFLVDLMREERASSIRYEAIAECN